MGWVWRVRKQPVNVTLFVNGFPVLVYFGVFQCNGPIAYRAQHDHLQGSYWQNFLSNRERDFKHNLPDFWHTGNPDGHGVLRKAQSSQVINTSTPNKTIVANKPTT